VAAGPEPAAAHAQPSLAGTVLVFLSAVGFSIKAILIKIAYGHGVDAVTVFALRMLFSAPFFVLMAWWAGRTAPPVALTRRDWLHVAAMGFIGYYLASLLDFLGLQYVSAGFERLVLFLYPTIVVLLSAWLLKTPVRRRHVVALVLSYAGIGLVFTEQLARAEHGSQVALGAGLVFASAVVYSFYLVGSSRVVHRVGAMRFTAWAMLVSTFFALLQFFLTHRVSALDLPLPVYGLSLALAVFATVLPALFMSEGLRRVGANHAALVGSIGPVVTMVLGAAFLGETLGWLQLSGAALVLGGVTLVSIRLRDAQASKPA
jgi:drug/metabolite transporter (DMT)-like permease